MKLIRECRELFNDFGVFVFLLCVALCSLGLYAQSASTMKQLPSSAELAAFRGDKQRVLQLLKGGFDVNHVGADGMTLLTYAVSGNHVDLVRLLLAKGAEPNADGGAAMLEAAGVSNIEILRALLASGASLNLRAGPMLMTPLMAAVHPGGLDKVRLILERGADPNRANELGMTALSMASTGMPRIVAIMIAHGANVNSKDKYGVTPLMEAARCGKTAIVRLLLEAGADPRAKDKAGWDPERYAKAGKHEKIVLLLKEAA